MRHKLYLMVKWCSRLTLVGMALSTLAVGLAFYNYITAPTIMDLGPMAAGTK
jgi:hypothetical protein